MDGPDGVGTGQAQEVVVAPQVPRMSREPLAPEVRLGEPVALEHRAHRAVEHQDALPDDVRENRQAGVARER